MRFISEKYYPPLYLSDIKEMLQFRYNRLSWYTSLNKFKIIIHYKGSTENIDAT